uniref:Glycosidase n=1 Tax=Caulobacter sp. (strain K31) TaxID=366602 RepID=B0SV56_CAUSK
MNADAAPRVRGGPSPSACPSDQLTHVELTWIEKKIEHWIRFGREISERIIDRRRRVVGFAPNTPFAFVRWAANDFGTIVSHLDIMRAVRPGEPYQTLPFVQPGGDILLRVEGWPKVERLLQTIDAIEALGIDAADISPDHWRHVHNRLSVGAEPRVYSRQHHDAWLKRRSAQP